MINDKKKKSTQIEKKQKKSRDSQEKLYSEYMSKSLPIVSSERETESSSQLRAF